MDEDSEADIAEGSHTHTHNVSSGVHAVQSSTQLTRLPVCPTFRLPDDEDGNSLEDGDDDLAKPPFSSTEERGYQAFVAELSRRIDTPMLEAIDAMINWTSAFSLLTLKMLCQFTYTSKDFYRFEVQIVFATPELFESAPWRVIDGLLARASRRLPGGVEREEDDIDEDDDEDEDEDDEDLSLRLSVSVNGWNVDGREGRARMRDLRRNLPRTLAEDVLEIELDQWYSRGPRWAPASMPD